MPKEVVQYPRTGGNSGTEISIHWSKGPDAPAGGLVQIAATRHVWIPSPELGTPPQGGHADHNHCSECVQTTGGLVLAEMPSTVWSDELTRGEINKLIRTLRRARDDAFGADA